MIIIIYSVCPIFTNPPDWRKALSNGVKTHLLKLWGKEMIHRRGGGEMIEMHNIYPCANTKENKRRWYLNVKNIQWGRQNIEKRGVSSSETEYFRAELKWKFREMFPVKGRLLVFRLGTFPRNVRKTISSNLPEEHFLILEFQLETRRKWRTYVL